MTFKNVELILRAGEEAQITKRRKVIARISAETADKVPLPDFIARLKEIYGDQIATVSGADLISADREGR